MNQYLILNRLNKHWNTPKMLQPTFSRFKEGTCIFNQNSSSKHTKCVAANLSFEEKKRLHTSISSILNKNWNNPDEEDQFRIINVSRPNHRKQLSKQGLGNFN